MISVLIVEDHTLVREGLKQILALTPDISVAGEAGDGRETLNKIQERDYDVVLLDISLPGRSGVDVLKQIKRIKPEQNVLILSMYPEEQFALRSIRSGASGYLTKRSASTELVAAIRKISQGGRYISESLAEVLASSLNNSGSELPHENLSDREYEIMRLIAKGKTITEIGKDLSLSVNTVSTYRSRIMKKMNIKTNAELTYYAFQNQLVE